MSYKSKNNLLNYLLIGSKLVVGSIEVKAIFINEGSQINLKPKNDKKNTFAI